VRHGAGGWGQSAIRRHCTYWGTARRGIAGLVVAHVDLHDFPVIGSALLCRVGEVRLRERGEQATLT
jgi:hypothetical protein